MASKKKVKKEKKPAKKKNFVRSQSVPAKARRVCLNFFVLEPK